MKAEERAAWLERELAEAEATIASTKKQADRWRYIANEMGYEPKGHAHDPLPEYLQKRIARFREMAAASLILTQKEAIERLTGALEAGERVIDYAASLLWVGRPAAVRRRPAEIDISLRTFRKARSTLDSLGVGR